MVIPRTTVLKKREKLELLRLKQEEKLKALEAKMKAMEQELVEAENAMEEKKIQAIGRVYYSRYKKSADFQTWLENEVIPHLKPREKKLFHKGASNA